MKTLHARSPLTHMYVLMEYSGRHEGVCTASECRKWRRSMLVFLTLALLACHQGKAKWSRGGVGTSSHIEYSDFCPDQKKKKKKRMEIVRTSLGPDYY